MTPGYWWPFLLILFLAGLFFQAYLLSVFALMLAAVSGLARWWQRHSLDQVTYRRRPYYRRAFPGERVPLRLEAENRKLLPVSWLRVTDPWPRLVGPEDESLLVPTHLPEQGLMITLYSLRWFERAARAYTLVFRKRGVYPIGPATVESGDIFGLFENKWVENRTEFLTVFPELLPFEHLRLPADDPFGDRQSQRRLYEDPNLPMGVRDYLPDDDFRRVHWPATARTGQLQVKVYQPVSARVLAVCLNVSTFQYYWEGVDPELLEHMVSASATLIKGALEAGYRVGLISNGTLSHADQPFRVPPGRSPQQLSQLFSALAGVTPFVSVPFERLLLKEVPKLPYGARLFIITGIITDEMAETLLRLKQHGRNITLLSFAVSPPPHIPGVRIVHVPYMG